mgnify:CR=1 FL=1|jgi:gamma-glutamyltranspeptidase/glutathione hydrolase
MESSRPMAFSAHGTVHRSTVTGCRGMVASGHPLASLAGLRILMQGGNAIDAAVAIAAALNVAEPYMSGIGGVGYMHIYSARDKEHKVLDYVGLTPAATDIALYDDDKRDRGPLSHLVPGACGGWLEALARYGSMDAAAVFAPAIEYAEQGVALTVKNHEFFAGNAADLHRFGTGVETYLIDGKAPAPGQILVQKDLAETFRRVAADGADAFYRGELAERIVRSVQESGGLLTAVDLQNFQTAWLDPAQISYRDYQIFAPAPPCQAVQYLQTLKIMEGFDVAAMGHNSAETLHRFIETTKLCMADRAEYAALANAPTQGLLSEEYAAERRVLITERAQYTSGERYTAQKAAGEVLPGQPPGWMKDECTTHFDAIDAAGNAVSCTQSLGSGFGSAMVVPGTGIALNNFMRWFDLEPTSPNAIGPNKKNEMCLSPAQVWDEHGLRLLIGTPGGHGILQTTPQMIMNVLDHDMNVQAAIEAARLKTGQPGYTVDAETRIAPEVFAELEKRGHQFNLLGDWSAGVGGGQGIMVDCESGAFMGGADPRRDGYALGW